MVPRRTIWIHSKKNQQEPRCDFVSSLLLLVFKLQFRVAVINLSLLVKSTVGMLELLQLFDLS